MTRTFTENDLVKFLYGELNQQETAALNQALITNPSLQEELNNLKEVVSDLNGVTYKPSERSVNKILKFSKGFAVQSA